MYMTGQLKGTNKLLHLMLIIKYLIEAICFDIFCSYSTNKNNSPVTKVEVLISRGNDTQIVYFFRAPSKENK